MNKRKYIIVLLILLGTPLFIFILFVGMFRQESYINDINTICHYIGNKINKEKCKCYRKELTCPILSSNLNNILKPKCLCSDGNYTAYIGVEFTTVENKTIKNYSKYTCGDNITFLQQRLNKIPKLIPCWYDKQNVKNYGLYTKNNKSGVPYIVGAVLIFVFIMVSSSIWFWSESKRKENKEISQIKSNKLSNKNLYHDLLFQDDDDDLFKDDDLLYTDRLYSSENIVVN